MALSPEAWGLIAVALTGVVSWWGRRLESAGTRAIASQGAAAEQWHAMAVFQRDRAEKAEAKADELEKEYEELVAELQRQISGLERRLVDVGEDVRVAGDRP